MDQVSGVWEESWQVVGHGLSRVPTPKTRLLKFQPPGPRNVLCVETGPLER